MCTMIASQIQIQGCGKGTGGWFDIGQVDVSYDHPFHFPQEHSLNIDFVNESLGPGARVAVELDAASALNLAYSILAVLEKAKKGGFLADQPQNNNQAVEMI